MADRRSKAMVAISKAMSPPKSRSDQEADISALLLIAATFVSAKHRAGMAQGLIENLANAASDAMEAEIERYKKERN